MIFRQTQNFLLPLAIAGLLIMIGQPQAAEINLPDMGSPADAILSKSDEAKIGRAIMQQIRAQGDLVEDPQITEYINEIGHRISAYANDGGHKFTFFVIDFLPSCS